MNKFLQNFLAIILLFILISGIFALLNPQTLEAEKEISFSQLSQDIESGKIKEITVTGDKILAEYISGEKKFTFKEPGVSLFEELNNYGVDREKIKGVAFNIKEQKESSLSWLLPLLSIILPLLIFGWFFWMIFRQAKEGAGQTFSFLKPPAKMFSGGKTPGQKVYFKDIADLEEAKEEIKEIIDFLKNPKRFFRMGARIPRGVLLVGPPGTGKTMLAQAVANEAGVPFFSMAGSAFVELFVGVGAARTRQLFETAKKHQPSIIFIDELDAIGKVRMPGIGGGHEEREQTLNQILAEMDGFEKDTGVIVIAATNRPESLDPALLRPGRFDRRIVLDLPDVKGREAILKIHCKDKPLSSDVDLKEIAERTPGFSGADLANLVNEAAILATRRNKQKIFQTELTEAIEKVLLGPERKSHLLSEREREISAYHETGHALVAHFLPGAEIVRKVSIVSRGMAAGYTLSLPKEEKRIATKSELLTQLSVFLGGYAAEKLVFGEISTGAANDLEKASILARNLVVKYGMSRLGPVTFGKREALPFLGWETEAEKNYSEKIAEEIDRETSRFIKEAEERAIKILKQKRKVLEKIAKVLMEKETIEKEEFEKLASGGKIKRKGKKNIKRAKK
jgi:cell division protease FtsH